MYTNFLFTSVHHNVKLFPIYTVQIGEGAENSAEQWNWQQKFHCKNLHKWPLVNTVRYKLHLHLDVLILQWFFTQEEKGSVTTLTLSLLH